MARYQQSKHALGSDVYLTLVLDDGQMAEQSFVQLWESIEAFEDRFSRFREDSELTLFNARVGQPVEITAQFYALLSTAKTMAMETDGLYNPLILPALQQAGYKGSWPNVAAVPHSLNYERRTVADAHKIKLARATASIPRDTALDFGGIGKGYLLDALAEELANMGIDNYWLSLGGDILCNGVDEGGKPWQIAVQDAHDPERASGMVGNAGKRLAVATSGITKRKGAGWHHIIDPRTLRPAASDVLTATVCAASATEADVFAKCLVILGSKAARSFIDTHHIADALIQITDAKNKTIKIGAVWSN